MGQHKETDCPQCGRRLTVNDSREQDPRPVVRAMCDNCRVMFKVDELPSFKGDRILVNKFAYSVPFLPNGGKPKRWDVVVFHYPEKPEMNYIKRLVGLPNEEIRIHFGDIHVRPLGSAEPFQIEHRPLGHQQAMQMHVWDDRRRPRAFADSPDWNRWRPNPETAWSEPSTAHYSAAAAPPNHWAELRYHHLVPTTDQWAAALSGRTAEPPKASLITDYYAYNMGVRASLAGDHSHASHFASMYVGQWVGDLTLALKVRAKPNQPQGAKFKIELVESGIPHTAEFDLAKGAAQLARNHKPLGAAATVQIADGRDHDLVFANVDNRLTLWVDGKTPFADGRAFDRPADEPRAPTAADLSPAAIAVQGAAELAASDLVLSRDIYYTLDPRGPDYTRLGLDPTIASLSDPTQFPLIENLGHKDFAVRPGHFFMLGDNSPSSSDSRAWGDDDQWQTDPNSGEPTRSWDPNKREPWELPESLLVGKAFFVYWPHGVPFWPNVTVAPDFQVPFRPYVERMRWIR
jgi:signal peptidase I